MKKLMDEVIDYLDKNQNEQYGIYYKSMKDELSIPETRKKIKNLAIINQSFAMKENKNARYCLMPKLRRISSQLNPYVLDDYESYFDNEHVCLVWIKKLLKQDINTIEDFPINSCCGILVQALLQSNLENKQKLSRLINVSDSTCSSWGVNIIIPRNLEIPSNETLIKKISYTLREQRHK